MAEFLDEDWAVNSVLFGNMSADVQQHLNWQEIWVGKFLLTLTGLLNLRFLLSDLILLISLSSRLNPRTSRFCARRPWLLLLGMTAI